MHTRTLMIHGEYRISCFVQLCSDVLISMTMLAKPMAKEYTCFVVVDGPCVCVDAQPRRIGRKIFGSVWPRLRRARMLSTHTRSHRCNAALVRINCRKAKVKRGSDQNDGKCDGM
eukprot:TRINITY_DN802_c0_g1_i12.p2 TRINITY_DN802_c0_g1~~TRINITY_DN802_c0_g1_i12.p2  ORF type:complete len:128 (-),score=0.32 TRINITY_DN802_c0_g1_i12:134-478(-)